MEQESKQEGQVKEEPKEETSKETPKPVQPVEKATSEKTYTETEWRKMQSMKDQEAAKAQKLERELTELRKAELQRKLEARQKEIQSFEGEPDEQARVKRKHALEDSLQELESKNQELSDAVGRKYDNAMKLAEQYNLGLADARELMAAETPREMELMAQIKVAENRTVPETPTIKPDSGTSDAGGDSDETFLKSYSEGKSDDHARAKKLLDKMK